MSKLMQIAKGTFLHKGQLVTVAKVRLGSIWYYFPSKYIPPAYCPVHGDRGRELTLVQFANTISKYQCGAHEWTAIVARSQVDKPIDLEEIIVYGIQVGSLPEGPAPCPGMCSYGKIAADDKRIKDIEEVLAEVKGMNDVKLFSFDVKRFRITRKADNADLADLYLLQQISSLMEQYLRASKIPSQN